MMLLLMMVMMMVMVKVTITVMVMVMMKETLMVIELLMIRGMMGVMAKPLCHIVVR